MKYYTIVLVGLFLISQESFAQNCKEDITNLNYSIHEDNYDLSFELKNLTEFEISLFDVSKNRYLIDNSNFRPVLNLSAAEMNISGSRVLISAIANQFKKEDLAIILNRKDNSCEPVKVELRKL